MAEWISQTEFAKRLGLSVASVSSAIDSGRISSRMQGKRPVINWKSEHKKYIQTSKQPERFRAFLSGKKVKAKSGGNGRVRDPNRVKRALSAPEARRLKETWQAKKLELEYQREAGRLVDAELLAKTLEGIGNRVKKSLLGIPDRTAELLAAEDSSHRIRELLRAEVKQTLENLAHELNTLAHR